MLALEPRIMFDGAMAGDAVDAAIPEENASLQNTAINDQENAEKESSRNEVVIVDGSITDYQSIISSIGSGAEVFILRENSTIDDIANLLGDRSGIDAVHIFTHGSTGTLLIGDQLYDENNISDFADALAEIGGSLTETGDILLYGCNIAATGDGQSFLSQFAALTSADIAASGLSKADIREYIYQNARMPLHKLVGVAHYGSRNWPSWVDQTNPETMVPIVSKADDLVVVVGGGDGRHSAWLAGWGVTRIATQRIDLPG